MRTPPLPTPSTALAVALAAAGGLSIRAQAPPPDALSRAGFRISCPRAEGDTLGSVPAAAPILAGAVAPVSAFELRFTDSVPAEAEAAITFAASIWASYLRSDVPVVVDVDWRDRDDPLLLASAGPSTLFRDFPGAVPDTWYPVALAEAIAGESLNAPGEPDVDITVNAGAAWYFGTDASPPRTRTDLVTVALHELGHGLGFISSADTLRGVELSLGFSGRFVVYDDFLEATGRRLTDAGAFANPGELLLAAVTGADLTFAGPTVLDRNGGAGAPLFSPPAFDAGSSVSHFDEATYPPGSAEALMTPSLARGEAAHDPGLLALALMADLGWDIRLELSPAEPPSGVGDLAAAGVRIAPNPAGARLTVRGLAATARGEVTVTDARGAVVARATATTLRDGGLDLAALAPGVYALRVAGLGVGRFVRW